MLKLREETRNRTTAKKKNGGLAPAVTVMREPGDSTGEEDSLKQSDIAIAHPG